VAHAVVQLAGDPRTLGDNVGLPNALQRLDGERPPPESVADRPGGGEEYPEGKSQDR
jgi:hypothetical protein